MPMIVTDLPVIIDKEHAAKLLLWCETRGGVRQWENAEIGSVYSMHVYTPADVTTAPSWRYTESRVLQREDIRVNDPEVVSEFRGRFKRHYWGPGVTKATEAKANQIVAAIKDGSWTWTHDADRPGFVRVRIQCDRISPL